MEQHAVRPSPAGGIKRTELSDPLLFIAGAGRSGSTLLRNMLDSHPLVALPNESHFVVKTYSLLVGAGRAGDLDLAWEAIRRHRDFAGWSLGEEPVLALAAQHPPACYADLIRVIFAAYAKSQGKPFSADKTPANALSFPLLGELFTGSRFLHLVRDPRSVCMSTVVQPWHRHGIAEAARTWAMFASAVSDARRRMENRILELRYEDLLAQPETQLRNICSFLDISFDPLMLEYPRTARVPVGGHASGAWAPLNPVLRRWEAALSRNDVSVIEYLCRGQMERLGYRRAIRRPALAATAAGMASHLKSRLEWRASLRSGLEHKIPHRSR